MGESGAPPFHASATYACWWSPSVHDCHDAHSARTDVASLCETDSQPARADISSSLDDRGRARNTRPHSATDGPSGLNCQSLRVLLIHLPLIVPYSWYRHILDGWSNRRLSRNGVRGDRSVSSAPYHRVSSNGTRESEERLALIDCCLSGTGK